MFGFTGDDAIYGGGGRDHIYGGSGDDVIVGGSGSDDIWGGSEVDLGAADGIDIVDYSAVGSRIVVNFSGNAEGTAVTVSDGEGGVDTLRSIEKIVGTSFGDYLYYQGSIPQGLVLEIDGGPGVDIVANAAEAATDIVLDIDGQGNGTLSSPGGGTIQLRNFHTQIIGSPHDDEITDDSEGDKRIDGGNGDDVISVAAGAAMIIGGGGADVLRGGDGNDVLVGDAVFSNDTNQLHGGGGSDYLVGRSSLDMLYGDEGHDYIRAFLHAEVWGGAGNDFLDFGRGDIAGTGGDIHFGADDGHDTVFAGDARFNDNCRLYMEGLSEGDLTVVWEQTAPGIGNVAIVVNSTGASIVFYDIAQGSQYPVLNLYCGPDDRAVWSQINVVDGSVAAYDVALADYLAATAGDPADNEGTDGDDDLRGSRGNDDLSGGGGGDSFHSSGGTDWIDGGAGHDVLNLFGARDAFAVARDAATGAVTVEDETGLEGKQVLTGVEAVYFATDNQEYSIGDLVGYFGTPGDDVLVASDRDNQLFGLAGNDRLLGLGGSDWLDGGAGTDTLEGGAGDDSFVVDAAADAVVEAAGGGYDVVYAAMNWTLGAGQEVEVVATIDNFATTAINLVGNALANLLIGNAGANSLTGGGGADYHDGRGGNDRYFVDHASDVVLEAAGGGYDQVFASAHFTLTAGQEVEVLATVNNLATTAINLTGNERNDYIVGNEGANTLTGGGGRDYLDGRGGNDRYVVDHALDNVLESAGGGSDTVFAAASYALGAGQEVEVLATVNNLATTAIDLTGNALGNSLIGNAGDNLLNGGAGRDWLDGRGGNDRFAFTAALGGDNYDAIVGAFTSGEDRILLDDTAFAGLAVGALAAGAFVVAGAAQDGDDRIVYNSATGGLYFDADGTGERGGCAVRHAGRRNGARRRRFHGDLTDGSRFRAFRFPQHQDVPCRPSGNDAAGLPSSLQDPARGRNMTRILIVASSANGEASVSNRLAARYVDRLRERDPAVSVVLRDVGANPLPHLTAETVAAIKGQPATEAEIEARALSDALIAELQEADQIVIASPMYNFGMSSTLKAWFDHVARAGITFRYTKNGPEGLLKGKKTVVIESRAGFYGEGPGAAMDGQEPHLRTLLGFMGLDDVSWVRAEKLAFGPDAAEASIEAAAAELGALAGEELKLAA